MPATVEYRTSGTIESPCPPRTNAVTSSTDTPNSCARNSRNRELSSTPAIPTTLFAGSPDFCCITHTIASSGFVITITNACGQYCLIPSATVAITPAFFATKSSRLIPGCRGNPAVTMTTSDPSIAA